MDRTKKNVCNYFCHFSLLSLQCCVLVPASWLFLYFDQDYIFALKANTILDNFSTNSSELLSAESTFLMRTALPVRVRRNLKTSQFLREKLFHRLDHCKVSKALHLKLKLQRRFSVCCEVKSWSTNKLIKLAMPVMVAKAEKTSSVHIFFLLIVLCVCFLFLH